MIPILGETVWSIIHGPATTGHLVEVSQFLKRPIDVWAEDRLLLFGQCHNRHEPRLHLMYKSLTNKCPSCKSSSSSKAVGHFTLLQGHEPRNPDARSHPENCGFDVVSDQTGYPATALRQVAVQRILAKLYESRLRGRDHHFQCSHCSVSGGTDWKDFADKMYTESINSDNGHAHVHVYYPNCEPKCHCPDGYRDANKTVPNYKIIKCIKKYDAIKKRYVNGSELSKNDNMPVTIFADKEDLKTCLKILLENHFEEAKKCICKNIQRACNQKNIRADMNAGTVSDYIPTILGLKQALRYVRGPPARFIRFTVERAEAVFKCTVRVQSPNIGVRVATDPYYLVLVSAYPVWQNSNERLLADPKVSIATEAPNNSRARSARKRRSLQGSASSSVEPNQEEGFQVVTYRKQ